MTPFLLQYLLCFLVFAFLQAMFINGWHDSFSEGNIFNPIKKWVSKRVNEYWLRPVFGCVRCESSLIGALTFFPTVIYFFGFRWEEIVVYVADVFILVFLNYYLYKHQ